MLCEEATGIKAEGSLFNLKLVGNGSNYGNNSIRYDFLNRLRTFRMFHCDHRHR